MPMKEKSRTSIQATGATRLKFRSRIFSSESTSECSESNQETKLVLQDQKKQKVMREHIQTPQAQENLLHRHQS